MIYSGNISCDTSRPKPPVRKDQAHNADGLDALLRTHKVSRLQFPSQCFPNVIILLMSPERKGKCVRACVREWEKPRGGGARVKGIAEMIASAGEGIEFWAGRISAEWRRSNTHSVTLEQIIEKLSNTSQTPQTGGRTETTHQHTSPWRSLSGTSGAARKSGHRYRNPVQKLCFTWIMWGTTRTRCCGQRRV